MKLTPRLALNFIMYATALLSVVGLLAYYSGRNSLRLATISELSATAIEKQAALSEWVEEKQLGIALLATDPAIIEGAAALIGALPGSPEAQGAHDKFVTQIQPRVDGGEFLTIMLIDPETGEVIAATDPSEEGKFKEDRPFFISGKLRPFVQNVYYALALQGPAMTAAAPLKGPDGRLLGVLAGRINLEEMNSIINRRSGLRQTDDAFLVNTSNLFVTQPYLVADPAVLQRGIHTEASERCLTRTSGAVEAEDYRGIPAVIVYRWLPERELCLIVKMDQAEAYAPARAFGGAIAIISAAALLVAGVLAVGLARSLTRPILALQDGAARFGRGELDTKLPETSQDELGALAREFNQMAASLLEKDAELRAYAGTLEQKVQERTKELQESHSRLSRAEQVGQIGSWEWNIPENRVTWSDGLYKVFGSSPQELDTTYETYLERVHPQDREFVRQFVGKALQERGAFEYECRILRADEQIRNLFTRGEVLLDEHGEPVRMIGLALDTTERKRAEEAVRESEERLSGIIGSAMDAIITIDQEQRIILFNPAAEQMFRYSAADVMGQHLDFLLPERVRAIHREHVRIFGETRLTRRAMGTLGALSGLRADGDEFPMEASISQLESSGQKFYTVILRDITERKRAEAALQEKNEEVRIMSQQLWQAAKLATMGELAASIAHELNNPLATVSLRIEILQARFSADDPESRSLQIIDSEIKRMGSLVANLLQFSRRSSSQISTIKVNEEVINALDLIQYHLRKNRILTVQELSPKTQLIQTDRQQLRQVFLNLFTNAADAMPLGGMLTIRTWSGEKPQAGITTPLQRQMTASLGLPVSDLPQVFIEVSDTGEGIPPDRLEKVWEPFFTTKPEGKGTGLGLAICRRIIQEHGGSIEIISDGIPGKGTTIRITLPALNER